MAEEPFQQRMNERKIYEAIVDMIVDAVNAEYKGDVEARLRIYNLVADNFHGMVRALKPPVSATMLEEIENGVA